MKYFIEVPHQYSDTNNLDTAVKKFLSGFQYTVFEVDRMEIVKKTIIDVINALSDQYKRCTRLKPKFSESVDRKWNNGKETKTITGWNLYVGDNQYNSYLRIVKCREESDIVITYELEKEDK